MNDNVVTGLIGGLVIFALLCMLISDLKETAAKVEFAKSGLVQKVVEGKIVWTKP